MAVYFLRARHISRGKGGRVTRAAAYRAGERILDLRTSETHDYSDRRDIPYKEVVLPADLTGRPDMAWTQDRSTLWNAAEHAGLRRNSRLAREWLVFIPPELTPAQRAQVVRTFASGLAEKYRCAVDVCIHEPRPGADSRNHHAHLLMTTREVTPEGLGRRTTLELGGRERRQAGLGTTRDEYLLLRERWAQVTNEALRRAGLTARVDHRSLESQGVGRAPVPSIPEKVFYAERRAGEELPRAMRFERGIGSGSRRASTRRVTWRASAKGTRRNFGGKRPSISRAAGRSPNESAGTSSRGRSAMRTAASSTKRAALWRRAIPCSRRNAASRVGSKRSEDSKTIPNPSGRHGGAGSMRMPTRSTASSARIARRAPSAVGPSLRNRPRSSPPRTG
jgi:hypothetical protein